MPGRRVVVFGPAYLDRLLRVDRPLIDPALGPPLDQSVDGVCEFGTGPTLDLIDPSGYTIAVNLPAGWPGPTGRIRWKRPIRKGLRDPRFVRGLSWQDDLGGMGAGYAAALNGRLHGALGLESDPTSRAVSRKLDEYSVDHHPIRVPDAPADWTLLVTSGPYGDKLPIGFRGCHARLTRDAAPHRGLTRGAICASWLRCRTIWRRRCCWRRRQRRGSSHRRCGT